MHDFLISLTASVLVTVVAIALARLAGKGMDWWRRQGREGR